MSEPVRGKNDLGTPAWFLALVCAMGTIILDPCSNPWSLVPALVHLSAHRGEDGLTADWYAIVTAYADELVGALTFSNPPYGLGDDGRPLLPFWAAKIVSEAARGLEIIVLVPLAPDTRWFRTLRDACTAKCEVERRIGFVGGAHGTGQIRSCAFYFGPRRFLFCHVFESIGEVKPYDQRRAA